MGFYNHHVMPSLINCLCGMSEITDQRRKLVPQAEGLVVEVGIGSGHNLLCFARFLMLEQLYSARSVLRAVLLPALCRHEVVEECLGQRRKPRLGIFDMADKVCVGIVGFDGLVHLRLP